MHWAAVSYPQINSAHRSQHARLSLNTHPCAELVSPHSGPRPHILLPALLFTQSSEKSDPKATQHLALLPLLAPALLTRPSHFHRLHWEPPPHTCDT